MTRHARNRFVAWLGIAATWLAIVAPVISQGVAAKSAAADPIAALCTVDTPDTAQSHASRNEAPAGHHDAASHFEACAYCGLLAHHLPIAPGAAMGVTRIERVARVAAAAIVSHVGSKSFNAASPRAPPIVS